MQKTISVCFFFEILRNTLALYIDIRCLFYPVKSKIYWTRDVHKNDNRFIFTPVLTLKAIKWRGLLTQTTMTPLKKILTNMPNNFPRKILTATSIGSLTSVLHLITIAILLLIIHINYYVTIIMLYIEFPHLIFSDSTDWEADSFLNIPDILAVVSIIVIWMASIARWIFSSS